MSATTPAPPTTPAPSIWKIFSGFIKIIVEIVVTLFLLSSLPFIILFVLIHWDWAWYSSLPKPGRNLDDALIALASVAGVLWSGAIISYSIHKKYTPRLRTGVQLLNFAILAPLVALFAEGWELRTAFYFAMWFYIISTLFSVTNLEMLKPGRVTVKIPQPQPNETPEQAKQRQQLTALQLKNIEVFKRVAHGTKYFALVSILCLAILVTAKTSVIAWSCLIILVVSLVLILSEVFSLVDQAGEKTP